jgi:zinc transport system substrate-binding protein
MKIPSSVHLFFATRQLASYWLLATALSLLPYGAKGETSLQVWVTLLPQIDLVQQVGGEAVEVTALVNPGESPGSYSPQARELAKLAKADLFFGIGVPTEQRVLERMETLLKQVRFIGDDSWRKDSKASEPTSHHDMPKQKTHSDHGDYDPHTWMDPIQMLAFVDCIASELSTLRPDLSETFTKRATDLKAELNAIDAAIRIEQAPYVGRHFYINHPSLGHFAKRYGLVQDSLEIQSSRPSAARLAKLVAQARKDQINAVFVQPQFNRSSAEVLARALKCPILTVDPLAIDYRANLRRVSQALVNSFSLKKDSSNE